MAFWLRHTLETTLYDRSLKKATRIYFCLAKSLDLSNTAWFQQHRLIQVTTMKMKSFIFMSCKAGFLLTISLLGQQEVIGFWFSSENQEPDTDQYFLKENIAWRSPVIAGIFLNRTTRSHRFLFFIRKSKTGHRPIFSERKCCLVKPSSWGPFP